MAVVSPRMPTGPPIDGMTSPRPPSVARPTEQPQRPGLVQAVEESDALNRSMTLGMADGNLLTVLAEVGAIRNWGDQELAKVVRKLVLVGVRNLQELVKTVSVSGDLNRRLLQYRQKPFQDRTLIAIHSVLANSRVAQSAALAVLNLEMGDTASNAVEDMEWSLLGSSHSQIAHWTGQCAASRPAGGPLAVVRAKRDEEKSGEKISPKRSFHPIQRAGTFSWTRPSSAMESPREEEEMFIGPFERCKREGASTPPTVFESSVISVRAAESLNKSRTQTQSPSLAGSQNSQIIPPPLAPETLSHSVASPPPLTSASSQGNMSHTVMSRTRQSISRRISRICSGPEDVSMRRQSWQTWQRRHNVAGYAKDFRIVEIPLKHLYFYQNAIAGHFSDGHSLQSTVDGLRSGSLTTRQLPLPHVMLVGGRMYCMGTRRLTVFQYLWGKKNPDIRVPVIWSGGYQSTAHPQGNDTHLRIIGGTTVDKITLVEFVRPLTGGDVDVKDIRRQYEKGLVPTIKTAYVPGTKICLGEDYFYPA
eukprot:Hpha_TRINITY_DN15950_c1_g1::TRINITY_DN15950_c1_g1_i1::g.70678::m.70678